MFGTIRRHQKWLWAVIVTLTIISFLYFFNPAAKNGSVTASNRGSLYGRQITEDEFIAAQREVYLRYFFMTGNWPDDESKRRGYDPYIETYKWLLLIQKQEQIGVHVSADSGADAAREMLAPLQRNGLTSPSMFVTQVLEPKGFTLDDFERYVRHFVGVQELIGAFGLSGKLVTPGEAASVYQREHEELATEAVFFSVSNYLSNVSAKPEALTQFYSNNLPNYRLPDRVQVSYAKFGVSNYLAQAETDLKTNLNDLVESNFQRIGTNYLRLAKTPELAKAKLREDILRERALNQAMAEARDFARPLVETSNASPAQLKSAAAKQKNATLGETKPFDLEEGPTEVEGSADFAKAAFALNPAHSILGPVPARDGAYVIALATNIPSENPPFDTVKEKVASDYKMDQARTSARLAGSTFSATVTNGMAQGKSFAELAKQAKATAVELPPFSLSSRSVPGIEEHLSLDQLRNIAFTTPPGKVSGFQPTMDGGVVLHVKSRMKVDDGKMKVEMPAFIAAVRQNRQSEAFNEWFRKEIERGARETPLMQRQPQQPSMGPRAAKK
jgi:hypothetical protein